MSDYQSLATRRAELQPMEFRTIEEDLEYIRILEFFLANTVSSIEIDVSEEDLQDLINWLDFHWTFDWIDVHLFNSSSSTDDDDDEEEYCSDIDNSSEF